MTGDRGANRQLPGKLNVKIRAHLAYTSVYYYFGFQQDVVFSFLKYFPGIQGFSIPIHIRIQHHFSGIFSQYWLVGQSLKTLVLRTPCFGSLYPQVVRVPTVKNHWFSHIADLPASLYTCLVCFTCFLWFNTVGCNWPRTYLLELSNFSNIYHFPTFPLFIIFKYLQVTFHQLMFFD